MDKLDNVTLEILTKVKSNSVKDILSCSLSRGYNEHNNNAHRTWQQGVGVKELEDFCKLLYNDWRNELIKNMGKLNQKEQEIVTKIKTLPEFDPEIIAKSGEHPFYDFFAQRWRFKDIIQPHAELQNGDSIIPEGYYPDDFLYVYGWAIPGNEEENVDARFYLNLKSKNIPSFVTEFYKKCRVNKLSYFFKFALCDDRNDPLVIYMDYKKVKDYYKIITEIKAEKPQLLEGTEDVSQNLGVIDGYIGYGDEPKIKDETGRNYSFNSIRARAISAMRSDLRQERDMLFAKNQGNEYFAYMPKPITFDDYCETLLNKYIKDSGLTGVEANGVMLSRFKSSIKDFVLYGKQLKDMPVYKPVTGMIKLSNVDLIKDLTQKTQCEFGNDLQRRAYLTKFMVFSALKLSKNERELLKVMHNLLIKGLKQDALDESCSKSANELLSLLDKDLPQLGLDAKAMMLLTCARFIEDGSILIANEERKIALQYDADALAVYEQLLGGEKIQEIIDKRCSEYQISSDKMSFNADTELAVKEYLNTYQGDVSLPY